MTIMNLLNDDDINLVDQEFHYFATIPPFDNFKFLGWSKDVVAYGDEPMGYEADDGEHYIPIFINSFCPHPISDEWELEQEAIDKGLNCVIFAHGQQTSVVKRYTSKEIKYVDMSFFCDRDIDEGFYYRS